MSASRPLRNRVDPLGELCAVPDRGRLMGNRGGRFHDDAQAIGRRRWATKQWIACVCEFKARRREVFASGYTELFFRDEPTALAAGHRPCFECRRAEALAFQAVFPGVRPRAPAMDSALHVERRDPARLARAVALAELPEGAMVLWRAAPHLWARERLWPWRFGAYGLSEAAPDRAPVITPASILAALRGGYRARSEGTPLAGADIDAAAVRT